MRKKLKVEKLEDNIQFYIQYNFYKILFTPWVCKEIPKTTPEDFDFFDENSFFLVFEDESYFRINQFCILLIKYRFNTDEIYKIWKENSRCNYVRLEQILKRKLRDIDLTLKI